MASFLYTGIGTYGVRTLAHIQNINDEICSAYSAGNISYKRAASTQANYSLGEKTKEYRFNGTYYGPKTELSPVYKLNSEGELEEDHSEFQISRKLGTRLLSPISEPRNIYDYILNPQGLVLGSYTSNVSKSSNAESFSDVFSKSLERLDKIELLVIPYDLSQNSNSIISCAGENNPDYLELITSETQKTTKIYNPALSLTSDVTLDTTRLALFEIANYVQLLLDVRLSDNLILPSNLTLADSFRTIMKSSGMAVSDSDSNGSCLHESTYLSALTLEMITSAYQLNRSRFSRIQSLFSAITLPQVRYVHSGVQIHVEDPPAVDSSAGCIATGVPEGWPISKVTDGPLSAMAGKLQIGTTRSAEIRIADEPYYVSEACPYFSSKDAPMNAQLTLECAYGESCRGGTFLNDAHIFGSQYVFKNSSVISRSSRDELVELNNHISNLMDDINCK